MNDDTAQQQSSLVEAMGKLQSYPALEQGCQLAAYIRRHMFTELGFTLSTGISVNKMIAKLAASFGKPNGQAVVVPDQMSCLLQNTKLVKA